MRFSATSARSFVPLSQMLPGFVAVLVACVVFSTKARGQESAAVPKDDYYMSFAPYWDGEYRTAAGAFRSAARGGVRSIAGRWVDSICYHAMIGESFYQMGELGPALEQYDAALTLFLAHQNWLLRVQFPPAVEPSRRTVTRPATWGTPQRRAVMGHIPEKLLSLQGRPDNEQVLQQGGVVAPPRLHPLNATEIVRCTALAIRRRAEIMGPACEYHPLTLQVLQALARRPTAPNHWSQTWIDAKLGMAYLAAGKPAQAVSELQKSLLIGGQFDHPLTPMALLELGRIALRQGNHELAANYFLEASYSAAAFSQYDVVEEALRLGAQNHLVAGQEGIYPPLVPAAAWAARTSKQLAVSMKVAAAENLAVLRQTPQATALLADVRRLLHRSEMLAGVTGARFHFMTATVAFQAGNLADGSTALASALAFQRRGSLWLFQVGLVDRLYTSGVATPRIAETLFDLVLREPTANDWAHDPRETLGFVSTPHPLPMEHWFEVTMQRSQHEKAFEIADRIRRHRFHSVTPLGGRLLSLRWIMEAPPTALTNSAMLHRQDLLVQFPHYAELSRKSAAIRSDLRRLPLAPEDSATALEQKELLQNLATISAAQEVVLHEMALRRVPSEFVFPPLRSFRQIQEAIPERQLLLAFLATNRSVYAFAVGRGSYAHWQIDSPKEVQAQLGPTLRRLGLLDRDTTVSLDTLRDQQWQESAQALLSGLLSSGKLDPWEEYDELVIVPDNVLWYLPFEMLPVGDSADYEPLLSQVRVRYAPTASMSIPDGRAPGPGERTALVAGPLFPSVREESVINAAVEDIQLALPGVERLADPLPGASSVQAAAYERLIVLRDFEAGASGPFDWHPAGIDRGNRQGTLAAWMLLPWQGPQQVILPGFHTAAESSLKNPSTGEEVFLSVCGLMASGARTILLSRWRTGGQSAQDLTREFVQELPYTSASQAWQRSAKLLWAAGIAPALEPRIKVTNKAGIVGAKHPFLWAGYQLIDTGWSPDSDELPPAEAAADAEP